MATVLDMPTPTRPVKEARVEIIADTVINQSGRGVPLFKGSVLDVSEADAALLISSVKAKKVGLEIAVKIVPNPYVKPSLNSK